VAQTATFLPLFPFVFASSAFVPTQAMPGWLQAFAEHQPVSAMVDGLRVLMLGGPTTAAVLLALAWTAAILAVFVPLAVRLYRRSAE
jgi:ABC-2 type transport system permease protein